jgi:hypothetical protein
VSSRGTLNLEIVVNTPEELFNAPAINPFSGNKLDILGMSGLAYIVRQLQARQRDWKKTRLLIRLPPNQITDGFEVRLRDAVCRYCRAKIEDNEVEIHLIRVRSSIGLGLLLGIVAAMIAGAYLLFTGPLAGASDILQVAIAATISLFAWVSLWDPLEALLFNPIGLMRENFILRRIAELEFVVEPDMPNRTATAAVAARDFDAKGSTRSESKG